MPKHLAVNLRRRQGQVFCFVFKAPDRDGTFRFVLPAHTFILYPLLLSGSVVRASQLQVNRNSLVLSGSWLGINDRRVMYFLYFIFLSKGGKIHVIRYSAAVASLLAVSCWLESS